MKITAQDFRAAPRKCVTLIGMSGAGKSYISAQLARWGWHNYACDDVIASRYLKDVLVDAENIEALSVYLGKLGNPEKGGFSLEVFKARQKAYYDAEVAALSVMGQEDLATACGHFVHDSTGSLCEIDDAALIEKIGAQTLFVYLKTGAQEEQDVLQRARDYPKPLFFPPAFLAEKLAHYLSEYNLASVEDIIPDDFSRWVFPILFEARKPKYQRLADLYGVSIPSAAFKNLKSSEAFIDSIAEHL